VVNRAGAGGQLGFEAIFTRRQMATRLAPSRCQLSTPFPLERPVRYQPLDFTFLANVVDDPNTIYLTVNSPLRTLQDRCRPLGNGRGR
jgi:tripartite-type tricarboxylate transporter receptor subunit TctC